ncbi:TIGR04222 domain-containing membrane protein [Blastococcus deserti]|uniref:TIGR04222 domain-containing membrane protein n=1 Tax=Blastococcus deserti TaxID=2259033 RepID=A0ABW4X6K4_9ACTN
MTTSGAAPPLGPCDLDLYDIAYLAGGLARLVDSALVAMVEAGRVRVHAPGQLAVAEPARRHPVEAAVLDAVGTRGHRSVDVILWRLRDDTRILAVGRRLVAEGLVSRWGTVLRRANRAPVPTTAGRRVLRSVLASPPTDPAWAGGRAVLVALHGRNGVDDALLRASLFEAFPVPTAKERAVGLRRRLDAARSDPFFAGRGGGTDAGGGGGGGDGGGR